MACLTYIKDQDIVAWSKHELASGLVVDGTVIKDASGNDIIYFVVKQDGEYYIEKMGQIPHTEDITGPRRIKLLDGSLDKNLFSVISTTVNNLQRFEGETVYAISNHIVISSGTVSSGSVTFDLGGFFTGTLEIGVAPVVEMRTLPIEVKDAQTSTIGEKKQGSTIHLGLYNTGHLEVRQYGFTKWEEVPLRSVDDPSAAEKSLFTGTTDQFKVPGNRVVDLQYEFRQRLPSPLCITHLGVKLDISSM
jgi:hypothetical protein